MSWSCYLQTNAETLADDLANATPSPSPLVGPALIQFNAARVAVAALVAAHVIVEGPLSVSMCGHAHGMISETDALDTVAVTVAARPEPQG